jgi:hypothetical protein
MTLNMKSRKYTQYRRCVMVSISASLASALLATERSRGGPRVESRRQDLPVDQPAMPMQDSLGTSRAPDAGSTCAKKYQSPNNVLPEDVSTLCVLLLSSACYSQTVRGHVDSIAREINVANAQPNGQGIATVNPIFTWVRLAQRIPVRIQIDRVPEGSVVVAVMTATVQIDEPPRSSTEKIRLGVPRSRSAVCPAADARFRAAVSHTAKPGRTTDGGFLRMATWKQTGSNPRQAVRSSAISFRKCSETGAQWLSARHFSVAPCGTSRGVDRFATAGRPFSALHRCPT